MTETRENRLRRMKVRAEHRGIKEMDLILGGWVATRLGDASDETLDLFEAVLAEADHDLYQWVSGQQPAPPRYVDFMAELAGMAPRGRGA